MNFDYFYGEQSESYAFYRIPKMFFTDDKFSELSSLAKVLYGILLDRVTLSVKSNWLDAEGRVYVYMTIESIEEAIGCCHQKSCKLLSELEQFGLIERKRQGLCKPTRIYVKNFIPVCGTYSQKYELHTYGDTSDIPAEVCETDTNNTENNKTDISKSNLILSGWDEDRNVDNSVGMNSDDRVSYRLYFEKKLDMSIMRERYPFDREVLDSILDLILDVMCSGRKTIRIAGDDKPLQVVQGQFMKLHSMHLEYVLDCMQQNVSSVRNIKQYLLAALYNAPMTMKSYYRAMVNHDKAIGKI